MREIENVDVELPSPQKPSKQWLLKEYEINIRFLSRGCVIKVGCKEIPFESVKIAMAALNAYVENPEDTGTEWLKELV